jgi:carbon storage regulator
LLVLSRNRNERINIGTDISLVIVEVRGDKVRLGIDAPKELSIVRPDAKNQEKRRGK